MKTTKIKIGGREFALAFTLNALCDMEATVREFDLRKVSDYVKSPAGLLDMVYILAKQGEILEGRTLDVQRDWFGAHIPPNPRSVAKIQVALLDAMADGMRMEMDDSDDGEKDAVLEEIKKKETMEN